LLGVSFVHKLANINSTILDSFQNISDITEMIAVLKLLKFELKSFLFSGLSKCGIHLLILSLKIFSHHIISNNISVLYLLISINQFHIYSLPDLPINS
jgi:hypothetical protein